MKGRRKNKIKKITMEKLIDSSVSFKMFYEEHKDTEETRAKRKRSTQRSREVAEKFLQLKQQGLPIDKIMEILRRDFPAISNT